MSKLLWTATRMQKLNKTDKTIESNHNRIQEPKHLAAPPNPINILVLTPEGKAGFFYSFL